MKTLLLIYNPTAGSGRLKVHLATILEVFARAGFRTTIHFTRGKDDATQVAAELGGQFDRVVCCGGDGTLSEVVAGLLTLPQPPSLGYIPAGTTNDSAKNFHIPKEAEPAAVAAAFGPPRPFDIGFFNGKSFAYIAAFGAFTQVAYDTPKEWKARLGHLAYVMAGAASLSSIQPYALEIEHDGGTLSGNFIYGMVSNTVSVGGFNMFPPGEVKLDDGLHEVMLVREVRTPADLQRLIASLLQKKPVGKDQVVVFHTSRLTVTSRTPLPWTLDGEYGGDPTHVEIVNHRKAISVVCGQ